jgi:hypothetical protein
LTVLSNIPARNNPPSITITELLAFIIRSPGKAADNFCAVIVSLADFGPRFQNPDPAVIADTA